jgi:hypothetical protein
LHEYLIANHPISHTGTQQTKPSFMSSLLAKVGIHD